MKKDILDALVDNQIRYMRRLSEDQIGRYFFLDKELWETQIKELVHVGVSNSKLYKENRIHAMETVQDYFKIDDTSCIGCRVKPYLILSLQGSICSEDITNSYDLFYDKYSKYTDNSIVNSTINSDEKTLKGHALFDYSYGTINDLGLDAAASSHEAVS